MKKKDFENLKAALQEVVEIERGEREPSRVFKVENKIRENMRTLKQKFFYDWKENYTDLDGENIAQWLVVVIQMPNEQLELITNQKENILEKIDYYMSNYDDDLFLYSNPRIKICNWMFA